MRPRTHCSINILRCRVAVRRRLDKALSVVSVCGPPRSADCCHATCRYLSMQHTYSRSVQDCLRHACDDATYACSTLIIIVSRLSCLPFYSMRPPTSSFLRVVVCSCDSFRAATSAGPCRGSDFCYGTAHSGHLAFNTDIARGGLCTEGAATISFTAYPLAICAGAPPSGLWRALYHLPYFHHHHVNT